VRQIEKLRLKEERLLDLYLDGRIEKEQWSQRRDQIANSLATLTSQLEDLQVRLRDNQVTDEQIRGIQEFTREISLGIEAVEDDFEAKRHIVDTLDVQASLGVDESGEKVVFASCSFGADPELCIEYETTHHHHWPTQFHCKHSWRR